MAISNSDDLIDSRDVIERIAELEGERDEWPGGADNETGRDSWAVNNPEESEELAALIALVEEAEGYAADWNYGEALIRRSYFEDYARQLAEDVGAWSEASGSQNWPNNHIDWAEAARELEIDYTTVDFDGVEYLIR